MVTKGEMWGERVNQELGTNIQTHTTIHKIDNQQGSTV